MSDLQILGEYLATQYAYLDETGHEPFPPTVAVVGSLADGLGTADDPTYGDDDIAKVVWMTGYLTYPLDAIFIGVILPLYGLEVPDLESPPPHLEPGISPETDPRVVDGVAVWTHCIPTRESHVVMAVRGLQDDGTPVWEQVDPIPADDPWVVVIEAAHEYEGPVRASEVLNRRAALSLVIRDNGVGYTFTQFEPGILLRTAREWHRQTYVRDNQTDVN